MGTLALGVLTAATVAAPAQGAVTYRAAACAQNEASTSLTIAVPSGTATGDLLVASVGAANSAALATPSGWTQVPNLRGTVGSGQELVTWYRFAPASVPASYTFASGSGTDALAGSISTFRGADPANPIAAGAAQTIAALTTSDPLPNANAVRGGSFRYSATGSDDLTTTTYPAPMTKTCDVGNEGGIDIAVSTGNEPTGAGTTASRTVTRSDTARNVLQTAVISPPPCGASTLGFTPPSTISFGSNAITGVDQQRPAQTNVIVDDQSSEHAGWRLSATSTTFTNGNGDTLPTTASRVTDATATTRPGNCALPTSTVTYPQTIPAGVTAPTAATIYSAAPGTGAGPVNLGLDLTLHHPANTRIGLYTSAWTFTVSTGP